MFYFMLVKNYGEIRFFSIAGAVLGMVLYFCTLSIIIMGISAAVINFIKKVVLTAVRIIMAPLRFIIKLLTPLFRVMRSFLRKKARGAKQHMHIILKKV